MPEQRLEQDLLYAQMDSGAVARRASGCGWSKR